MLAPTPRYDYLDVKVIQGVQSRASSECSVLALNVLFEIEKFGVMPRYSERPLHVPTRNHKP